MKIAHPFLFAIAPILFLYAYNVEEVPVGNIAIPICTSIGVTLVLLFLLRLIVKSFNKAALITTFFLVLFFSYGHIRDVAFIYGPTNWPSYYLGPLWAVAFLVGIIYIVKSRRSFSGLTKFLNITVAILIAISIVNIGIYEVKIPPATDSERPTPVYDSPDIYYIVLDRYGRQDVLEELYGYDNSGFIEFLTDRGFYVAGKSRCRYDTTLLSMPSSLNMGILSSEVRKSKTIPLEMTTNSKVSRFLKAEGYRYIYVDGGLAYKRMTTYADDYLLYQTGGWFGQTNFEKQLLRTTALSPLEWLSRSRGIFGKYEREVRLYAFDALASIPDIKQSTFVYAHILCPHGPYVFDREGNPPKQKLLMDAYLDQLIFISSKVEVLVDELLTKSDTPPIIIIQSDTGIGYPKASDTTMADWIEVSKMGILNAYYFPDEDYTSLYESIYPENTFRVIFNQYFGENYELLEDE